MKLNKFIICFLSILFSLFFIEFILQVISFTNSCYLNHKMALSVKNKKDITIMCIGDSISGRYPKKLEKYLLKKSSKQINVIPNIKYGYATTYNYIKTLQKDIDKFKPDIIISMLGACDWKIIPWENSKNSTIKDFLMKSKIYRLFYFYLDYIEYKKIKTNTAFIKEINDLKNKYKDLDILSIKDEDNKKLKDFDTDLYKLYKKNKYEKLNLLAIFSAMYQYPYASEYYEYEYKQNKKTSYYNRELFLKIEKESNDIYDKDFLKNKIYDIKISSNNYNDTIWGALAINSINNKNYSLAKTYFNNAEKYRNNNYNRITKINYNKIVDIIYKNKCKLFVMQYPLRNIKPLKKLLKENKNYNNIIFISNEQNFKKSLYSNYYYGYFFIDNIGGDFGHLTDKGDQLLIQNIGTAILQYLSQ